MQSILSNSEYTFDASAKTITLAAPYDTMDEENIIRILNLTTYAMIYDCDRAGYSISVAAGVITHEYGNTDMQDTDVLQIVIDAPGSVAEGGSSTLDYESITVADSAIGGTSATYLTATRAEMTLETAQIRIRVDGTDPTSSEGHLVEVGDVIVLTSASQISNFKAIRTGASSGVLKVTYYN